MKTYCYRVHEYGASGKRYFDVIIYDQSYVGNPDHEGNIRRIDGVANLKKHLIKIELCGIYNYYGHLRLSEFY